MEDGAVRQEFHRAGGRAAGVQGVRRRIDRPDVAGHDQESGGGPPRDRVGERDDTAHSPGEQEVEAAGEEPAFGVAGALVQQDEAGTLHRLGEGAQLRQWFGENGRVHRHSEHGDAVEPAPAVGGVVQAELHLHRRVYLHLSSSEPGQGHDLLAVTSGTGGEGAKATPPLVDGSLEFSVEVLGEFAGRGEVRAPRLGKMVVCGVCGQQVSEVVLMAGQFLQGQPCLVAVVDST